MSRTDANPEEEFDEFVPDAEAAAGEGGEGDAGEEEWEEESEREIGARRARIASIVDRALAGTSGAFGIVVLILFFTPWAVVSCGPVDVGRQSGFQAAAGRMDSAEESKESKASTAPSQDPASSGQFGFPTGGAVTWTEESDKVPADWPLFAVPIGAAFAFAVGAARFLPRGGRTSPLVPTAFLGLAFLVLVAYGIVGCGMEREFDNMMKKGGGKLTMGSGSSAESSSSGPENDLGKQMMEGMAQQMGGMFRCERTTAFTWVVICAALALASSFARLFLPAAART